MEKNLSERFYSFIFITFIINPFVVMINYCLVDVVT